MDRKGYSLEEQGWVLELIEIRHSGRVWVWLASSNEDHTRHHVVVIRGSQDVRDWRHDWELVWAALGGKTDKLRFVSPWARAR